MLEVQAWVSLIGMSVIEAVPVPIEQAPFLLLLSSFFLLPFTAPRQPTLSQAFSPARHSSPEAAASPCFPSRP